MNIVGRNSGRFTVIRAVCVRRRQAMTARMGWVLFATLCSGCMSPWQAATPGYRPSIRSSVPRRFLTDSAGRPVEPPANVGYRPVDPDVSSSNSPNESPLIIRHQNVAGPSEVRPADYWRNESSADGSDRMRYPLAISGQPVRTAVSPATGAPGNSYVQPVQYTDAAAQQAAQVWGLPSPQSGSPYRGSPNPPQAAYPAPPAYNPNAAYPAPIPPQNSPAPNYPPPSAALPYNVAPPGMPMVPGGPFVPQVTGPGGPFDPRVGNEPGAILGVPTPLTDIIVNVQETQTGRLMLGAAVNSDAGVTGQFVIDERNFDWQRYPTSWDDLMSGSAFRGAGQGFRLEALPGSQVQRYMLQYSDPYLMNTRVSMNLSGYLFDRKYLDYDEQRLGGRLGFGYRITPDLSVSFLARAENVEISNLRTNTSAELNAAAGDHDLYSGRFSVVQDTRDIPFQPTQGYYLELNYEQVFGSFDYPRGEIDFRRYFLLAERPDGSGRHVLGFSSKVGLSGSDTPIFENFFAGGYSTMRGFDFRGASPKDGDVVVGGEFQLLNSVEYLFPITADDMLKGVAFCDYGTVEREIKIDSDNYRVAFGMGLRIFVPAMGPAPIALDFAVPVARAETDRIQQFSFFVGLSR